MLKDYEEKVLNQTSDQVLLKKIYIESGLTIYKFDLLKDGKKIAINRYSVNPGFKVSKVETDFINGNYPLDDYTVAELDEMALLLNVSDLIDGYWDLLKADKLEVLKGMM